MTQRVRCGDGREPDYKVLRREEEETVNKTFYAFWRNNTVGILMDDGMTRWPSRSR